MDFSIGFTQFVDLAFMALVLFTCSKTLFSRGERMSHRTKQWREELRTLEATLRELIGEASAAGNNLNRNLLKRREELNTLIGRMEEIKEEAEAELDRHTSQAIPTRRNAERSRNVGIPEGRHEGEELPNPSWERSPTNTTAYGVTGRARYQKPHFEEFQTLRESDEINELRELAESQDDSVSLTTRGQRSAPARGGKPKVSELAKRIEQINQMRNAEAGSATPVGVDPTAYKVARRLLASGKEIHVVARKLELPIAEVRMIERMMRIEQGERGDRAIDEQGDLSIENDDQHATHPHVRTLRGHTEDHDEVQF